MVVIMRAEDGPAGVLFLTLLEVICNFEAFSSNFLSGFLLLMQSLCHTFSQSLVL